MQNSTIKLCKTLCICLLMLFLSDVSAQKTQTFQMPAYLGVPGYISCHEHTELGLGKHRGQPKDKEKQKDSDSFHALR